MSQENVEVVRRWIEFYNRRDTDGLMQLTTSDYEMKSVFADVESGGIFRGYAGFPFEYFKTLDDAYDQFQLVVQDFIDVGAAVLMVAHIEWRGRGSGAEGEAVRKGAVHSSLCSGSGQERSSARRALPTAPKPSKPWGLRSSDVAGER